MNRSVTHFIPTLSLACAMGLLATTVPASVCAADVFVVHDQNDGANPRERSATVVYNDLDLATDEGRSILRKRTVKAAKELCRQMDDRAPPAPFACKNAALMRAYQMEKMAIARAAGETYAGSPAPASSARVD